MPIKAKEYDIVMINVDTVHVDVNYTKSSVFGRLKDE